MNNVIPKTIVLLVMMVVASILAAYMRPHIYMAENISKINYSSLVPNEFGDWKAESNEPAVVVNPQAQELLNSIYTETVARTFIERKSGRRIMLSLAYGKDQSHGTQIHKPEVCYPAQGFSIISMQKDKVQTVFGALPVMRLVTKLGPRNEPVTYWIRVGEKLVRGATEQNFARINYGLHGLIPDGLLFRVSELSADPKDSFALQDKFVSDLLNAINPASRNAIIGRPG